eukprot:5914629-Prymnesium_polylepis.1
MLCHPSAHLAHEPTWGGVILARSGGTFREHALLDEARKLPGFRDGGTSGASSGLYRTGDTRRRALRDPVGVMFPVHNRTTPITAGLTSMTLTGRRHAKNSPRATARDAREDRPQYSANLLSQRGEVRPRLTGAAHKYHPELSGEAAQPNNVEPSAPALTFACYAIGGMELRRSSTSDCTRVD